MRMLAKNGSRGIRIGIVIKLIGPLPAKDFGFPVCNFDYGSFKKLQKILLSL
jgi:hypothetical protein